MADEVDRLEAFLGDGERRDTDVILGADGRNNRIEVRGFRIGLKTEHSGQRLGDVHVEADRRLAVRGQELGRRVRRIHADGELAVLGHIIRQHFGDRVVLLHAGNIVTGQFAGLRTGFRRRGVAVVAGAACRAGGEHGHAQHERGGGFQGFSCLHVPSPMDSYRPVQPNRILA